MPSPQAIFTRWGAKPEKSEQEMVDLRVEIPSETPEP